MTPKLTVGRFYERMRDLLQLEWLAGDEGSTVIEHGGSRMHAANKRALAAADQRHAKFAIERSVGGHQGSVSGSRFQVQG